MYVVLSCKPTQTQLAEKLLVASCRRELLIREVRGPTDFLIFSLPGRKVARQGQEKSGRKLLVEWDHLSFACDNFGSQLSPSQFSHRENLISSNVLILNHSLFC
jgi:hypothetical protein